MDAGMRAKQVMTDAGTIPLLAGTKTCSAPAVGGAAAPLRMRFLLDSGLVSKLAHCCASWARRRSVRDASACAARLTRSSSTQRARNSGSRSALIPRHAVGALTRGDPSFLLIGLQPVLSQAARIGAPGAVWVLATKGWNETTLQRPARWPRRRSGTCRSSRWPGPRARRGDLHRLTVRPAVRVAR